jgi:AcrR family transcriptional regulator
MPASAPAHLRADARRNREQVLAAARLMFAERGADIPMEDIGRAAGVGKGTLYRHFPTRDHLCAAVSGERFAALEERAAALASSDDPWAALVAWLAEYDVTAHRYRGLSAHVADGLTDDGSVIAQASHPMRAQAEVLLTRAQEHGDVAPEVRIVPLLTMVSGLPDGLRGGDGASELLPIVVRGIRAPAEDGDSLIRQNGRFRYHH